MLSADADVDKSSEIDATQRVANTDGRSPRGLLSSSFSDELAARYGDSSKIFAVSVKDRGGPEVPGYLRSLGDDVAHVDPATFDAAVLNRQPIGQDGSSQLPAPAFW